MWMVTAFTFYENISFIKYVPGDFENNYLIVSCVDVIGALVAGWIYQVINKPRLLFFTYSAIAAISSIYLIFETEGDEHSWALPINLGINRAGIIMNFTTVFMAHPNFFPTLFVATSLGISNFFTRILVILAPLFAESEPPLPQALMASLLIIQSLSALCLKDG